MFYGGGGKEPARFGNPGSETLYDYFRGTIVNRTYGEHKNLCTPLFLPSIFGPILLWPPVIGGEREKKRGEHGKWERKTDKKGGNTLCGHTHSSARYLTISLENTPTSVFFFWHPRYIVLLAVRGLGIFRSVGFG